MKQEGKEGGREGGGNKLRSKPSLVVQIGSRGHIFWRKLVILWACN